MNDRYTGVKKFLLLVVVLFICWYAGRFIDIDVESYRQWLQRFPAVLSGLVFVGLYVLLTFFVWFGSKDVLRIVSAVLFGPVMSTVLVTLGELGNMCVLFGLSRKLGQEFVEQRFKIKAGDLNKARHAPGLVGALAVRSNPLIPFRFMDLGAGLSEVRFSTYLIACVIATPVRVYWLQYILAAVGESVLTHPLSVYTYLKDQPFILGYSAVYFLGVVVLTLFAVLSRERPPRKTLPD